MSGTLLRKRWVDVAKGIGIVLVIVQHWIGSGNMALSDFICSFHMPLFFLLGGIVYKSKPFDEFALKKFKSLLIPLFSFELIFVIPQLLIYFIPVPFSETLSNALAFRGGWFLLSMFLTTILFAVISHIKNRVVLLLTVSACFALGLICAHFDIPYVDSAIIQALVGVFFYYFGSLLTRFDVSAKIQGFSVALKVPVLLISAGAMVLSFFFYNDNMVLMYKNAYGNPLIFTVKALIVSIALVLICIVIDHFTVLENLGKHSLMIMIFQFPIYLLLKSVAGRFAFRSVTANTAVDIVCIVVVIVISYIAAILTDKYLPFLKGNYSKK